MLFLVGQLVEVQLAYDFFYLLSGLVDMPLLTDVSRSKALRRYGSCFASLILLSSYENALYPRCIDVALSLENPVISL